MIESALASNKEDSQQRIFYVWDLQMYLIHERKIHPAITCYL